MVACGINNRGVRVCEQTAVVSEGRGARVMSQGEYTHSNTDKPTPHTSATTIALTVALDTCTA
jgi:hypothetical protein